MGFLYIKNVYSEKYAAPITTKNTSIQNNQFFDMIIISEDFTEYVYCSGITKDSLDKYKDSIPINFKVNEDSIEVFGTINLKASVPVWQGQSTFLDEESLWSLFVDLINANAQIVVDSINCDLNTLVASRFTDNVFVTSSEYEVVINHVFLNLKDNFNNKEVIVAYVSSEWEQFLKKKYPQLITLSDGRGNCTVNINTRKFKLCKFKELEYSIIATPEIASFQQYQIERLKMHKLAIQFVSRLLRSMNGNYLVHDINEQRKRDMDLEATDVVFDVNVIKPTMPKLVKYIYGEQGKIFQDKLRRFSNDREAIQKILNSSLRTKSMNGSLFDEFVSCAADILYECKGKYDPFLFERLNHQTLNYLSKLYIAMCVLKCMMYRYGYFSDSFITGSDYKELRLCFKRG